MTRHEEYGLKSIEDGPISEPMKEDYFQWVCGQSDVGGLGKASMGAL